MSDQRIKTLPARHTVFSDVKPLVSVIMPVHNAADFIGETIASVQAQSLIDWELLAADDGSCDASAAILSRMAAEDPRIRPLSTDGNLGAGAARNCAMAAARGRFLAFLDADDLWHPEKLRLQIAAMQASGLPLSCTSYLRHDIATGRRTLFGVPARASRAALLKTNTVACSTAILDRSFFGPRQMSTLRRRQDFLFWLELLTATPVVLGLPQALMTYRQHANSLSAPKTKAAANTWTMYRQSLGMPLLPALWYFGNYALRGTLRHHAPGLARKLGWLHKAETLPS